VAATGIATGSYPAWLTVLTDARALALGAAERGKEYVDQYPGRIGWIMFGACLLAVLMAGAKIFDAITAQRD
jgi:hypothetical protein